MKKLMVCAFFGICLLVVAAPSGYADGLDYDDYGDYKTKLKEGFDEIITSPKPLIDSVKEEYDVAEFKPFGVFGGFIKGSFYAVGQLTRGVYRVLTFNVWDDESSR